MLAYLVHTDAPWDKEKPPEGGKKTNAFFYVVINSWLGRMPHPRSDILFNPRL